MVVEYGYLRSRIGGDYARAVFGLVLCLAPFHFGLELAVASWILMVLAALFLVFIIRTILRHLTVITVNNEWVRVKILFETTIHWDSLTEFNLAYFSTWRSGGKGWMQIRLKGSGKTLRIESSLLGFEDVAARAKAAAGNNNLALNSSTVNNLLSLGFSMEDLDVTA